MCAFPQSVALWERSGVRGLRPGASVPFPSLSSAFTPRPCHDVVHSPRGRCGMKDGPGHPSSSAARISRVHEAAALVVDRVSGSDVRTIEPRALQHRRSRAEPRQQIFLCLRSAALSAYRPRRSLCAEDQSGGEKGATRLIPSVQASRFDADFSTPPRGIRRARWVPSWRKRTHPRSGGIFGDGKWTVAGVCSCGLCPPERTNREMRRRSSCVCLG